MNKEKPKFDLAVGGQALIEGVMMRTPHFIAMSVRKPNGEILCKDKPFISVTQKYKPLGLPIIRGIVGFVEMMIVGTKALNFSADVYIEEDEEINKDNKEIKPIWKTIYFTVTFIVSLVLMLFIFKFVPLWIASQLEKVFPILTTQYWIFNAIDGGIKIIFLITYMWGISLFKDIYRVFEYHGAEHKSVFAYENELDLSPENAKTQTRFHPRCGTSFVLVVFLFSIIVYTIIPRHELFWVNLSTRILALPLIAGISYEFLKLSGKYSSNKYVHWLSVPGLWLQRITTKEPDESQLEVALTSLKRVLELEKKHYPTS